MTGSISRKLYQQLLFLYPEPFRHEFGNEMLGIFDECRAAQGSWRLIVDVVLSAAKQQIRYLSAPVPKRAPPYSEIASSPDLARIFAVAGFGAALIIGVLAGAGKPKAPESWTLLRPECRFWFPTAPPEQYCPGAPESMSASLLRMSAGNMESASTNPASQQLKNWLAAYDGTDWQAYLAFVQKSFVTPPEPMLRYPAFRDMTGGFDLKKIETETAVQVTALIQERNTDQMARIVVEVETAEPHRIVKLHPEPIAPPHLNEKELIDRTQQLLQKMASADKFSGTVLVAKNGQPVFAQAYGLADREQHIPNTLDTRFGMASMDKMFTAVAVLQIVKAGELKLDDPIGKYLTDYPNKELASKVTIRHLLSHTGGTGDFFGPEFERHRRELHTHEDYIHLFGSRPPRFEPGSRFEYSNYGFVILGALIDRVSGQNYFDYVRDHVYIPAGMTSTAVPEPRDQPVPDLSLGYTKQGGNAWHTHRDSPPFRGTAAGGGYTTVGDLLRFANALQNNKLLDAHDTELLTTGHVATPIGIHYGYGFEEVILNGLRCFGHGGLGPGLDDDLKICPAASYVVVVLANMDPPAGQRISNFVVNQLPETQSVRR